MAEESPLSATGSLTEPQYEALAHPQAADGLIGHPNDTAPVSVSGGQVIVRASLTGLLRGFPWASGLTPIVFTPDLSGAARVDLVVLRLLRDDGYRVGAAIRTGTSTTAPAASTGVGPTDWYEIPLAEVSVQNGTLQLTATRAWYLGDDGQILCTSTGRPPMTPGRRIYETDTGRAYLSTGTTWTPILDDSGDVVLTAAAGWTLSSWCGTVRRKNGVVYLRLIVTRNSTTLAAGTDTTIATVPTGFRPASATPILAYLDSAYLARGFVQASGAVELHNYTRSIPAGLLASVHPASWPL